MIPTGQPKTARTETIGIRACRTTGSMHPSYPPGTARCKNARMQEALLDLTSLRCPRCAGQLVIRVTSDERGRSVLITLDTACIACGVSPWSESDERRVVFTPGAAIQTDREPDADAQL